jgi:hypothetical protein
MGAYDDTVGDRSAIREARRRYWQAGENNTPQGPQPKKEVAPNK